MSAARRRAAAVVVSVGLAGLSPVPAHAEDAALRICTTGDYRPLTFLEPATTQYEGIDVDMARDLAAALGRTPVFVPTTWPTLSADITTPGRCDIAMGGISVAPARLKIGAFTAPYLASGKAPITRSASAQRFTSVEAINQPGARVIEKPGGSNEQFAREHFPLADLEIWPDNTTIFDELAAGRADVMITDAIEARYQAQRHPGLAAVNPDHPFTHEDQGYLLPLGSPLSADVRTWLDHALSDGVDTLESEA